MAMAQLPDELLLSILDAKFPCRQSQIRALATLLGVSFMPVPQPAMLVLVSVLMLALALVLIPVHSRIPPHVVTASSTAPRQLARVLSLPRCFMN